jgi:hypothetical protein
MLDLTESVDKLVQFLANVRPMGGGGDGPEDWVGALLLALNRVSWRTGSKTIVWIADEGAHGSQFCGFRNHEEEGPKLVPLIKELARRQIFVQGLDFEKVESTFLAFKKIYDEEGGPSFTWEKFKVGYNGTFQPPKRVDVLGRDIDAHDYPRDFQSDDDYDMEDEFKNLPRRRNCAPVIDESAIVIHTVPHDGNVGGKISSIAAAAVAKALGT